MKRFYFTSDFFRGRTRYTIRDTYTVGNSPSESRPIIACESLELVNAAIDALNAIQNYEPAR